MIAPILTVHRRFLTPICTHSVSTFRSITREPARCIAALRLTYAETSWLTPQLYADVSQIESRQLSTRSRVVSFSKIRVKISTRRISCEIFQKGRKRKEGKFIQSFSPAFSSPPNFPLPTKPIIKQLARTDSCQSIDRLTHAFREGKNEGINSFGTQPFLAIIVCTLNATFVKKLIHLFQGEGRSKGALNSARSVLSRLFLSRIQTRIDRRKGKKKRRKTFPWRRSFCRVQDANPLRDRYRSSSSSSYSKLGERFLD